MDSKQHQTSLNTQNWFSRVCEFALLFLIHSYRALLGPLMGGVCRFEPSCSVYAESAIRLHGPLRGSLLAIKRLAKCHPWGSFGPDPVPTKIHHVTQSGK